MQIKTTVRYHFTPTRMAIIKKRGNDNVDEAVERVEPLHTAGGIIKWCSCGNGFALVHKVKHTITT